MATATLNGKRHGRQETISKVDLTEEKKVHQLNPVLCKLEPEMIRAPYAIELSNGKTVYSDQVCYQKADSQVFGPLEFDSPKECVEFAKGFWGWKEQAEARRIEKLAEAEDRRKEQSAEKLMSKAVKDPVVLEKLRAMIEAA